MGGECGFSLKAPAGSCAARVPPQRSPGDPSCGPSRGSVSHKAQASRSVVRTAGRQHDEDRERAAVAEKRGTALCRLYPAGQGLPGSPGDSKCQTGNPENARHIARQNDLLERIKEDPQDKGPTDESIEYVQGQTNRPASEPQSKNRALLLPISDFRLSIENWHWNSLPCQSVPRGESN